MSRPPQAFLLTGAVGICIGLTTAMVIVPRSATGYPTTTVSSGVNPVVSVGGAIYIPSSGTSITPISAPADQDLIITDVVLGITNTYSSDCDANFQVELGDGSTTLGQFAVGYPNLDKAQLHNETISFSSGIRIAAGDALHVSVTSPWVSCGYVHTLNYTVSGYHAQP